MGCYAELRSKYDVKPNVEDNYTEPAKEDSKEIEEEEEEEIPIVVGKRDFKAAVVANGSMITMPASSFSWSPDVLKKKVKSKIGDSLVTSLQATHIEHTSSVTDAMLAIFGQLNLPKTGLKSFTMGSFMETMEDKLNEKVIKQFSKHCRNLEKLSIYLA